MSQVNTEHRRIGIKTDDWGKCRERWSGKRYTINRVLTRLIRRRQERESPVTQPATCDCCKRPIHVEEQ